MPSQSPLIKVLLLFMVGIILPTGFLVYLGILSIRSETLLLHKESQERVGKTAQAIENQTQSLLNDTLTPFAQLSRAGTDEDFRKAHESVRMLLRIDAANHLLFPIHEVRRKNAGSLTPLSLDQRHAQEVAEEAEFKSHDYPAAIQGYQTLLKEVESPRWKAILLTSLAGALMKHQQYDAAQAQYQEILSRYGQELDQQGYPFGLVIASQIGELQKAKGRDDLAVASHLRVYQDILNNRWDLSWEELQFFARRLTERIEPLQARMSESDRVHWHALQGQFDRLKAAAFEAQEFMRQRWPALERALRSADRSGSPFLVFENPPLLRAVIYIPSYESHTNALQSSVIAELDAQPLIAKLRQTIGALASASNLAYRLELVPGTVLAMSDLIPQSKRWPFQAQLAQVLPALTLEIAPTSDVPVERAAARRRQVYVGMVFLAAIVILMALGATWYAISREIEFAQMKARFVASMSHELKTPLSIIGLVGQKLQLGRYETEAEAQEYYGMLTEETSRLRSLIDDVLDFSRLMENRQPYHLKPVDVVVLVRETLDRFRSSIKSETVVLDSALEPEECFASVDPEAFSRALLNLLDNAVKYSPPDRMRITVSLKQKDRMAILAVSDEGYGIPPEEAKLVFDRFYRGRSATEHLHTKGAGLGLSIVQHIVQAHQGRIDLQSVFGKGSIFTIYIPLLKG